MKALLSITPLLTAGCMTLGPYVPDASPPGLLSSVKNPHEMIVGEACGIQIFGIINLMANAWGDPPLLFQALQEAQVQRVIHIERMLHFYGPVVKQCVIVYGFPEGADSETEKWMEKREEGVTKTPPLSPPAPSSQPP